jgi:hypothetical protein
MAAKAALLALVGLLGACISEYRPPKLAEPHAVLKIRRTYDTSAGVWLREFLLLDDHLAFAAEVPAGLASAPRIDSSLIHPMPASFDMSSSFFHQEMRTVQESYWVQEPYSKYESYDCSSGHGTKAVHRTCSRNATHYRTVTRHRWVSKRVNVVDAECQAQNRFAPAAGRVYLLQYSYQEHGACTLSCFEQVPNSDGTFRNLNCPIAPPAP